MQFVKVIILLVSAAALLREGAIVAGDAEISTSADPVEIRATKPEKDDSITCLTLGESEICCRNCTSCCKGQNQCNLGLDNRGWGNIGSSNFGDFNFGNNSRGDCNMEDESFGIGGPEYNGCPQETWDHIVRFCTLFPYYHKCHSPPVYFGEGLADLLTATVLRCDSSIPIQPRPKKLVQPGRRSKRSTSLQRVRVARDSG